MAFSQNQLKFAAALQKSTGLNPRVILAWMTAEEPPGANSGYHGTQDWLNVGITDSGPMGQGNAVWTDPTKAGAATGAWIKGQWSDPGFGKASGGIQNIAKTAGQSPQAQLATIAGSGWASSGYGGVGALTQLYNQTANTNLPASSGTGTNLPASSGAGTFNPTPSPTGSNAGTVSFNVQTQQPTFNQAGYDKALQAYKVGDALALQKQANPFPGGSSKALSPGPSPMGVLYQKGVLSTTPPSAQSFAGTKTVTQQLTVAHQQLQGLSGQELAHAPQAANAKVQAMTSFANSMLSKPYIYGGGHGSFATPGSPGVDCSGFVSAVLHAGGYLSQPVDTTSLPSQQGIQQGPGKYVTIYDNTNAGMSGHAIIKIGNQFYEAGGNHNNVAKIPQPSDLSFFSSVLHPAGL